MTTTINNEHKKLNVPNLRFPEFQGEWDKYELGDICDIITDFVAAGSFASLRKNVKYYQENNYAQLIRTIDLKNNFTNSDFVYVDEVAYDFLWRVQLKEPNIVLPNIGANIGEKYYVKPQDLPKNKNVLGPNAILLRSKCNDTHFVYFRLSTSSYDNEMKKLVGASGQPKFNKTDLKKVSLFMPSLIEQKRIAYFLALLEERIVTQNKIIEDLKKLKSAIYQEIFSNLQGEECSLLDLAEIIKGQQINGSELSDSGKYYVMNGGIAPSGYYDSYNTEADTISISEGGNSCGYVQYNSSEFWSGGHCYTLRIKPTSSIATHFLFHYLKWKEPDIMALRIGSGLPNIQKKDLSKISIIVPTLDKQLQLTVLLSAFKKKIENEEMYVANLDKQKQYLLQQMFI